MQARVRQRLGVGTVASKGARQVAVRPKQGVLPIQGAGMYCAWSLHTTASLVALQIDEFMKEQTGAQRYLYCMLMLCFKACSPQRCTPFDPGVNVGNLVVCRLVQVARSGVMPCLFHTFCMTHKLHNMHPSCSGGAHDCVNWRGKSLAQSGIARDRTTEQAVQAYAISRHTHVLQYRGW